MQVPSLFRNKYVRMAAIALAVINVLGYLSVKAYECLALFGLAAYSANCYCKNTVCAILAGLFVANFVFGCSRVQEGLESAIGGPAKDMQNLADKAKKVLENSMKAEDKCPEGQEKNDAGECVAIAAEVAETTQAAADAMAEKQ